MLKPQVLMFAILFAVAAAPATAMYKCKDSSGQTYYTDRPPAACLGKEIDVLSTQGTVLKKREAALTPEQRAARDAEEKRKQEEALAAKEERRKNQALVNTYASVKDIEDGRARALKQAEQAMQDIEKRIADAKKRAKKLESEKEFYRNKPLPKKLKDDISNNDIELETQQNALANRNKTLDEINAKYDEDKRRYLELTGAKSKSSTQPTRGTPSRK